LPFEPTLIEACNPALALAGNFTRQLPPVEFLTAGMQHVVVIAACSTSWLLQQARFLPGDRTVVGTGTSFRDRIYPARVGGEDVFGSRVRLASANENHTLSF